MNKGILLFALVTSSLYLPLANAQVLDPEELEKGCLVRNFQEQAYVPFRIIMQHDPAIKQTITDQHTDPLSRLIFDQVETGEEDPTALSFYTNSTDNWRIVVDMEYQVEATEDNKRPITIQYQTNNRATLTETVYRTGFGFCVVYFINAEPPPPEFTSEQILEMAKQIQKEEFAIVASRIDEQTREVIATKTQNNAISIILFASFVIIAISGWSNRSKGKAVITMIRAEAQKIKKTRGQLEMYNKKQKVDDSKFRKEIKKSIDNIIDFAKIEIKSANVLKDSPVRELAKEVKEKVGELRENETRDTTHEVDFNENGITQHKTTIESKYEPEIGGYVTPEDVEQQKENEESYEKHLLGETNYDDPEHDPLHLEEAKKEPKSFGLNKIKEAKGKIEKHTAKITEKIKRKEKDEPEIKDEEFYKDYYFNKLDNYEELLATYRECWDLWDSLEHKQDPTPEDIAQKEDYQIQMSALLKLAENADHLKTPTGDNEE